MKVLVFGGTGQLGASIQRQLTHWGRLPDEVGKHQTVVVPRSVDLRDSTAVARVIQDSDCDWVVNCAAWTNVDLAESNVQDCFAVNSLAVHTMAEIARGLGSRLMHFSTEAVYSGKKGEPYVETDPCEPVSTYGASKLCGDLLAGIVDDQTIVLRTSWLYSSRGKSNFPSRIRAQLESTNELIAVVDDVYGNPTSTEVLAQAAVMAIAANVAGGLYHVCAMGCVSKFEWAVRIAQILGFEGARIRPVKSSEFQTVAARPARVDLCCDKFEKLKLLTLPHWSDDLEATLGGAQ